MEHYESMGIKFDIDGNIVRARSLVGSSEVKLQFDKLIIATGAEPIEPQLKGLEFPEGL